MNLPKVEHISHLHISWHHGYHLSSPLSSIYIVLHQCLLTPHSLLPAIKYANIYNMYKQSTKLAPATYFGPPAGLILILEIIHGRISSINTLQGVGTVSPITIHQELMEANNCIWMSWLCNQQCVPWWKHHIMLIFHSFPLLFLVYSTYVCI